MGQAVEQVTKHCSKCREDKSVESFSCDRSRHDGLSKACKACENARVAASRTKSKIIKADGVYAATTDGLARKALENGIAYQNTINVFDFEPGHVSAALIRDLPDDTEQKLPALRGITFTSVGDDRSLLSVCFTPDGHVALFPYRTPSGPQLTSMILCLRAYLASILRSEAFPIEQFTVTTDDPELLQALILIGFEGIDAGMVAEGLPITATLNREDFK